MDIPLSVKSVCAPYLKDNNHKHLNANSIEVLSIANGTLSDYNETSATAPFGSASLVVPDEQVLTLAYNKSMLLRIQDTQMQDIPISRFSKKVAMQQIDEVFIPSHDAYSLAKMVAARPTGNKIVWNSTSGTDDLKLQFSRTIRKVTTQGGENVLAWVQSDIAAQIGALINFTGSDSGYGDGKKGYLGTLAGARTIEVPDSYTAGVYVIAADKRAVVYVTPKMDPRKGKGGMKVIEDVPGFGGIEIQLRDRGDTFVLNKKARNVATMESA